MDEYPIQAHDAVYMYNEDIVRPALQVAGERRPKTISFEVMLSPNPGALQRFSDAALPVVLPAVYSDPFQMETDWVTIKGLDDTARAIIDAVDKNAVGKDRVPDVLREVCLRLHNGSAYTVSSDGNAWNSPNKPIKVTLTRAAAAAANPAN